MNNPSSENLVQPIRIFDDTFLPPGNKPVAMGSGVTTALIGKGGMANVYQIWNSELEISRAVKLMHPNISDESKRHFQTEIKISAELSHPNIVEIHSVGKWNDLPYIEMELIDGPTLDQIVSKMGALPVSVCTAIAILVARALSYSHEKEYVIYGKKYNGIIHRDIKPNNIMISKHGQVKLMDFGIARPVEASICTVDGSIMGTIQYLAPEQLDGKETDVRTDVYSLGTVIYEVLTGVKAFPQINMSKLMMCKLKNDYRPLDAFDFSIPVTLRRLVHQCMNHEKFKRVQTARELLESLEKIHHSLTPDSAEKIMMEFGRSSNSGAKTVLNLRKGPPAKALSYVAGLVAALAIVAVFFVRVSEKPATQSASAAPGADSTASTTASQSVKTRNTPAAITRTASPPGSRPAKTASPEPAVAQPSPAPPKLDLIDKLEKKHGTGDLTAIFDAEYNEGNNETATRIYDKMPESLRSVARIAVYNLRALDRSGNYQKRNALLVKLDIDDGEFYLEQAKHYYSRGRIRSALKSLDKCHETRSRYMPVEKYLLDVKYQKARCYSKIFDKDISRENFDKALDSWSTLWKDLQSNRSHAYYEKAVAERQRLRRKLEGNAGG
ncbi:MAG: protein kinase [Chitinivibrionales bacterium]|nr:protein kinase [Chitinivibrionales bacterium]